MSTPPAEPFDFDSAAQPMPPAGPFDSDSGTPPVLPPPEPPKPADRGPPGIPGIIGVVLLGMLAATGFQVLGGCVGGCVIGFNLAITQQARDEPDFDEIGAAVEQFVASPIMFTALIIAAEVGFLIVALAVARRSALTRVEQFGLYPSHIRWYAHAPLVLGAILMAIIGQLLAAPLAERLPVFLNVEQLRESMTPGQMVAFLLAIAIAPGIVEELFFRGYVQRRLLRRLRPLSAILLSSVLFAIAHLDPTHVIFAFPIGLWLGFIAWRTGSIWPGAVCHALLNGLWNLWFIGVAKGVISAEVESVMYPCVTAVGILSFLGGIRMLRRQEPPAPAGPSVFAPVADEVVAAQPT